MYENYDVAIIGGGPAAVFAAYEFTLKYPTVSLIMLEEGNPIERRQCPLAAKKVDHCLRCVPCDIMRGFGGAGAFSDGKYNFTTEFGGWLSEYIPEKTVIELIDYPLHHQVYQLNNSNIYRHHPRIMKGLFRPGLSMQALTSRRQRCRCVPQSSLYLLHLLLSYKTYRYGNVSLEHIYRPNYDSPQAPAVNVCQGSSP